MCVFLFYFFFLLFVFVYFHTNTTKVLCDDNGWFLIHYHSLSLHSFTRIPYTCVCCFFPFFYLLFIFLRRRRGRRCWVTITVWCIFRGGPNPRPVIGLSAPGHCRHARLSLATDTRARFKLIGRSF